MKRVLQNCANATTKRSNLCLRVLAIFLLLYSLSYLAWSRIAMRAADKEGYSDGYLFVDTSSKLGECIHATCWRLYYPLIELESLMGTGRQPSYPPLQGLSR